MGGELRGVWESGIGVLLIFCKGLRGGGGCGWRCFCKGGERRSRFVVDGEMSFVVGYYGRCLS